MARAIEALSAEGAAARAELDRRTQLEESQLAEARLRADAERAERLQLEAELRALRDEVAQRGAQGAELRRALTEERAAAEHQLAELRAAHAADIDATLQVRQSAADEQLRRVEAELEAVRQQLVAARVEAARFEEAAADREQSRERAEQLQGMLGALRAELAAGAQGESELREEMQRLAAEAAELRAALDAVRAELGRQTERAELAERAARRSESGDGRAARIEEQLRERSAAAAAAEAELGALRGALARLEGEVAAKDRRVEWLDGEVRRLTEEVAQLRSQCTVQRENRERVAAELAAARTQLSQCEARRGAEEQRTQVLARDLEAARQESGQLRGRAAELQAEAAASRARLESRDEAISALRADAVTQKQQLAAAERQVSEASRARERAAEESGQARREARQQRDLVEHLQERSEELKSVFEEREQELQCAVQEIAELRAAAAESTGRAERSQEEVERLRLFEDRARDVDSLRAEVDAQEQSVTDLSAALSREAAEAAALRDALAQRDDDLLRCEEQVGALSAELAAQVDVSERLLQTLLGRERELAAARESGARGEIAAEWAAQLAGAAKPGSQQKPCLLGELARRGPRCVLRAAAATAASQGSLYAAEQHWWVSLHPAAAPGRPAAAGFLPESSATPRRLRGGPRAVQAATALAARPMSWLSAAQAAARFWGRWRSRAAEAGRSRAAQERAALAAAAGEMQGAMHELRSKSARLLQLLAELRGKGAVLLERNSWLLLARAAFRRLARFSRRRRDAARYLREQQSRLAATEALCSRNRSTHAARRLGCWLRWLRLRQGGRFAGNASGRLRLCRLTAVVAMAAACRRILRLRYVLRWRRWLDRRRRRRLVAPMQARGALGRLRAAWTRLLCCHLVRLREVVAGGGGRLSSLRSAAQRRYARLRAAAARSLCAAARQGLVSRHLARWVAGWQETRLRGMADRLRRVEALMLRGAQLEREVSEAGGLDEDDELGRQLEAERRRVEQLRADSESSALGLHVRVVALEETAARVELQRQEAVAAYNLDLVAADLRHGALAVRLLQAEVDHAHWELDKEEQNGRAACEVACQQGRAALAALALQEARGMAHGAPPSGAAPSEAALRQEALEAERLRGELLVLREQLDALQGRVQRGDIAEGETRVLREERAALLADKQGLERQLEATAVLLADTRGALGQLQERCTMAHGARDAAAAQLREAEAGRERLSAALLEAEGQRDAALHTLRGAQLGAADGAAQAAAAAELGNQLDEARRALARREQQLEAAQRHADGLRSAKEQAEAALSAAQRDCEAAHGEAAAARGIAAARAVVHQLHPDEPPLLPPPGTAELSSQLQELQLRHVALQGENERLRDTLVAQLARARGAAQLERLQLEEGAMRLRTELAAGQAAADIAAACWRAGASSWQTRLRICDIVAAPVSALSAPLAELRAHLQQQHRLLRGGSQDSARQTGGAAEQARAEERRLECVQALRLRRAELLADQAQERLLSEQRRQFSGRSPSAAAERAELLARQQQDQGALDAALAEAECAMVDARGARLRSELARRHQIEVLGLEQEWDAGRRRLATHSLGVGATPEQLRRDALLREQELVQLTEAAAAHRDILGARHRRECAALAAELERARLCAEEVRLRRDALTARHSLALSELEEEGSLRLRRAASNWAEYEGCPAFAELPAHLRAAREGQHRAELARLQGVVAAERGELALRHRLELAELEESARPAAGSPRRQSPPREHGGLALSTDGRWRPHERLAFILNTRGRLVAFCFDSYRHACSTRRALQQGAEILLTLPSARALGPSEPAPLRRLLAAIAQQEAGRPAEASVSPQRVVSPHLSLRFLAPPPTREESAAPQHDQATPARRAAAAGAQVSPAVGGSDSDMHTPTPRRHPPRATPAGGRAEEGSSTPRRPYRPSAPLQLSRTPLRRVGAQAQARAPARDVAPPRPAGERAATPPARRQGRSAVAGAVDEAAAGAAAELGARIEYALAAVCEQETALRQLLLRYLLPEEAATLGVAAAVQQPPLPSAGPPADPRRTAALRELRGVPPEEAATVCRVAPLLAPI
eukprot:TRINITY_DN4513_c0_g6_i1.p1 TRINITY_DN4513_c0_g6~~TRINITY_DN4513_c0_g6_i1.p1  ORF type:complete len:2252 (+),score=769.43 TRINITY_DN4513_c0_g6_i1:575-6757(+)